MISCCFFEGSCFVITFYVGFFWSFLCYFWLCPFFKIKFFLVWVCLSTFLWFIISFLDFVIVFKRISYPVLNWVNPVWVPLVFFFLIMLLFYDLWYLVKLR